MSDELREAPNWAVQSEVAHRAFQRGEEYEREIRTQYEHWRDSLPQDSHLRQWKEVIDSAYEFGRLAVLKYHEGILSYAQAARRKQSRRTSGLPDSEPTP